MWWRALGVAVVLLCAGVAGGYAVADRGQPEPTGSSTLAPMPAVSPSVPTPVAPTYAPDPDDPAMHATGLATETLRLRRDTTGAGVKVDIPVGWRSSHPSDNLWNFVDPEASTGTYLLRVTIQTGANVSVSGAVAQRIALLELTEDDGNIADFTVLSQTGDTLIASYVEGDHLRYTTERWVSFDGKTAYASVAVTGREVDQQGLNDLLGRAISSLRPLAPKGADSD
ncbi:hypothetical protein [Nocardioides halotolerans]|uniref:hypothetical protein n=1 Tax=Nocardioides halotolerans TaxID=433660 RepID=UPI0003F59153|nr:hypothetical protein [Nocardioides halotolerans]